MAFGFNEETSTLAFRRSYRRQPKKKKASLKIWKIIKIKKEEEDTSANVKMTENFVVFVTSKHSTVCTVDGGDGKDLETNPGSEV